jgi:predicted dehydrogenase
VPHRLRVAIVGAGAIAGAYADAIRDVEEIKPVAWCDLSRKAAVERASRVGAHAYASFERMLIEERPEALIIATPPNTHREIAERALASGCAVLCEKPFAPARADALAMIDAARAAGKPIAMAAKFRFVDDIVTARRWISLGAIGTPLAVEISFTGNVSMRGRWNADPTVSGGGVIADNGPHAFDLIRAIGGNLLTVRAYEHERYQNLDVEDTATVTLRCENGVFARADLSWSLNKQLPAYLNIYGTDGAIEAGWKTSFIVNGGERTTFGTGYDKRRAFAGILREFAAVVRGECESQTGAAEALATVDAVEAAYRSIAENTWSPATELVA